MGKSVQRTTAAAFRQQELAEDLAPLVRLLTRAKGFAVALLQCNVPVERERVVGEVLSELKKRSRKGRVLKLEKAVEDLFAELADMEPPLTSADALIVLGFEHSIPSEASAPALHQLNLTRELFREFPFPLVLVLPEYALTRLAREAPDFWAWRSGVFEVGIEIARLKEMQRDLIVEPLDGLANLSERAKRERLAVLSELLAAYPGDSDALQAEKAELSFEIARLWYLLGNWPRAQEVGVVAANLAKAAAAVSLEAKVIQWLGSFLQEQQPTVDIPAFSFKIPQYDVFISYAHADEAWVRELALNLHNAGLEVFYAPWEIGPGDVFVERLDRGLEKARHGVLVVSQASLQRPWVLEEYAALLRKAVEGGSRLIPVLHQEAELPPLLANRQWIDFRGADGPVYAQRVAMLAAALRGEWRGRPERQPGRLIFPPGTGYRAEGPNQRTLRIGGGESVLFGGESQVAAPWGGRTDMLDEKVWQLEQGLRLLGGEVHSGGATEGLAAAGRLQTCQLAAGVALTEVYLPPALAQALRADLEAALRGGFSLRLGLEVEDSLLGLPWETLCLAPGEPLALHPRVQLYRRVAGLGPTPALQVPGPLRILVVIGSPEQQNAHGELLDMEAELARILDAVEPARKADRRAFVRILENGTLAAIRVALEAERYHVLHFSCHSQPGVLVLEDDDGREDKVNSERLWREALPPDRGVPLVVLSGSSTALDGENGERELPGLAVALLERGLPAVVAMRAPVSDAYATAFCAELYRSLAEAAEPLPLRAFAEARQAVEKAREAGAFRGSAEWSTPLIFLRGEGESLDGLPLYDPAVAPENISEPRTVRLAAGILVRPVGDFVGRRADQRKILKMLRQPEAGGVVVRGLGGLGKSTLAAQLAQKVGAEGWLVVSQYGQVDPEGILEAVGVQLLALALGAGLSEGHPIRGVAQLVRRRDLEAGERLEQLGQHILEQLPLLLLLDNFEENLTPLAEGAKELKSEQLKKFLGAWLDRPGRSRLLLTCRYQIPLEGLTAHRLRDYLLGPLSPAEARKLFWRLPALDACSREDQERARLVVGGHPRALEYLDALLRGGKARFEDIEVRLEVALKRKGVEDPRAWLAQRGGDFNAALLETVTLAADDVLLESLLERLRPVPLAAPLLLGASVFRLPVEERALVWQISEPPRLPRVPEPDPLPEVEAPAPFTRARDSLVELGLLAPLEGANGGRRWLVHRWTATRLAERSAAEELAVAHHRAALYERWQVAKAQQSRDQDILDLLEAGYHHRQAGELDEAILVTEWVCLQLHTWGAYRQEEQLIHEVLAWLPAKAERAAAFFGQLGNLALSRGEQDLAFEWYHKALDVFQELGNFAGMAVCYHQLGRVAEERGNFEQALEWYRKSLGINQELGNRAGMASSYHQLGIVADERGDHDQALVWYRESLEIKEELGDRVGMANSFHQLGSVAKRRGDYDQALEWYRKSLEISESLGNKASVLASYHQLGNLALERGEYDQALEWYRQSLAISEELGNRAGIASTSSQIGVLLTLRGEPAGAVPLNLRSLAIRQHLRVPQARIDLHWLSRQRELLGVEHFREILSGQLDADSQAAVMQMIEDVAQPKSDDDAAPDRNKDQ